MALPIKFRILQMAFENAGMASDTILERLRLEYPKERCISCTVIFDYLQSLRISGLVDMELTGAFDDQGIPVKKISITEYGKSKLPACSF